MRSVGPPDPVDTAITVRYSLVERARTRDGTDVDELRSYVLRCVEREVSEALLGAAPGWDRGIAARYAAGDVDVAAAVGRCVVARARWARVDASYPEVVRAAVGLAAERLGHRGPVRFEAGAGASDDPVRACVEAAALEHLPVIGTWQPYADATRASILAAWRGRGLAPRTVC